MGWWSSLIGGSIATPIEAIGKVIDDVHTSAEEKAAARIVMERLRQEPAKLQAAINMMEAQHRSVFVAGWRPSVGWLCVAALSYLWIIRPIFNDVLTVAGFPLAPLSIGAADVTLLLAPLFRTRWIADHRENGRKDKMSGSSNTGGQSGHTASKDADKHLGKISRDHKLSEAAKDSKVVSATLKDLENKADR